MPVCFLRRDRKDVDSVERKKEGKLESEYIAGKESIFRKGEKKGVQLISNF